MRKIVIATSFILLLSCTKKNGKKCYECDVYQGNTVHKESYCGDDGGTRQFKDANGNNLQSICKEK